MSLKSYEHCCSSLQALASMAKVEGVVPLLHAPQPCAYSIQVGTMVCRPSRLLTAGTLIKKSEVIFGGEENLKNQIINLYDQYKPKIIIIINTCVPQLIGEDVKGVIQEVEEKLKGCRVVYVDTGFNFPRSMPLGVDMAWSAMVEVFPTQRKVPGSVGLIGRSGHDAGGSLAPIELFINEAGIPVFTFPASHINEMMKIVKAETIFPTHVVPYHTCKKLNKLFGTEISFSEVPSGVEGTSRFLRHVADKMKSQKLHDIVDREEKVYLPKLMENKARFAKKPIKTLHVSGPASELSISKILAEAGAKVTVVPSMRNKFAQKEMNLQKEKYGVIFHDGDFDTLARVS